MIWNHSGMINNHWKFKFATRKQSFKYLNKGIKHTYTRLPNILSHISNWLEKITSRIEKNIKWKVMVTTQAMPGKLLNMYYPTNFSLSCCKYGINLVNQMEINMKIKKENAKEDVMCTFVLDFPRLGEKMPTLSSQNS